MSKFGTLVLVRDKIPIIPQYNKAMQIGRTVVNFSIKQIGGSSSSMPREQEMPTDAPTEVTRQPGTASGGFGNLAQTSADLPSNMLQRPNDEEDVPEENNAEWEYFEYNSFKNIKY